MGGRFAQNYGSRVRPAGGRASIGVAWRSFEKDLREVGFSSAEIRQAWSRADEVSRVSIELMALAAGLVSIEDLRSEIVNHARNTFANVAERPFDSVMTIAWNLWSNWETLSARSLDERPDSVEGVGVTLLVEDCEQKLGWSVYPSGKSGMAARLIVRREIYSAVKRTYPTLGSECHRQFRNEWDRLREMKTSCGG
jgi:hypothetical protein